MNRFLLAIFTVFLFSSQVSFAQPAVPSICLVTVDDFSTHNIIYWDKTGYSPGDAFIIYREHITAGYLPIDTIPYDSLSEFHDIGHYPNVTKTRYKMKAMNGTGVSAFSPYHGTMYCNEPSYGYFTWNNYEIEGSSSPATDFVLARQDSVGDPWVAIDTIPASLLDFTDPAASAHPDGTWRVRTLWPITCNPTRAGVSTSRSNIRTHGNGLIVMTGLQEVSPVNHNIFNVYPNPSASLVTIQMYDRSNLQTVKIFNAYGQLLQTIQVNNDKTQLDVQSWQTGMYYIEVLSEKEKQTKSFIKL